MLQFQLESHFEPAGDQPEAIDKILSGFADGKHIQTLMGATGTGKTFTMAKVIQELQKPTLIVSHNKTLAAQLATEFKHFFPKNAVHYFVSYFDYYQPESYLPDKDMYIEKEATINQEIEMYRLGTLASLLSRHDVIIVASVSALYGLGQKEFFAEHTIKFLVGEDYDFRDIKGRLLKMQYHPVLSKIEQGMFEFQGEQLDIYSSIEKKLYRLMFDEDTLEHIIIIDPLSFREQGTTDRITIWPSTQFMQDMKNIEIILAQMDKEKEMRVAEMEDMGMLLEATRLKKRVEYDIRMIKEAGFVNGIENYSLYFDGRNPGEPPTTLFDYFPDDFLMIVDESHMTIPQFQAMPKADISRKHNLIKHGFRLPSAMDHRPLHFKELEHVMGWKVFGSQINEEIKSDKGDDEVGGKFGGSQMKEMMKGKKDGKWAKGKNALALIRSNDSLMMERLGKTCKEIQQYQLESLLNKRKLESKTLFASATPSAYEHNLSHQVVEQLIRPTGLLDPLTSVYPKSGDYALLLKNIDSLLVKKPHLKEYFQGYDQDHASAIYSG